MPIYIAESHDDVITHEGQPIPGTRADGYRVFLYKLSLNAAEDDIRQRWRPSRHGQEYPLHRPRSRRRARRDPSSRSWMPGQRVAACSCGAIGVGTSTVPISTSSCAAGIRARVAVQYFGASSRYRSRGQKGSTWMISERYVSGSSLCSSHEAMSRARRAPSASERRRSPVRRPERPTRPCTPGAGAPSRAALAQPAPCPRRTCGTSPQARPGRHRRTAHDGDGAETRTACPSGSSARSGTAPACST